MTRQLVVVEPLRRAVRRGHRRAHRCARRRGSHRPDVFRARSAPAAAGAQQPEGPEHPGARGSGATSGGPTRRRCGRGRWSGAATRTTPRCSPSSTRSRASIRDLGVGDEGTWLPSADPHRPGGTRSGADAATTAGPRRPRAAASRRVVEAVGEKRRHQQRTEDLADRVPDGQAGRRRRGTAAAAGGRARSC